MVLQPEISDTSQRQGFTHIQTLHWKYNQIFPSLLDLHKELHKNCFSTARHYQRPNSTPNLVLHRYELSTVHTTRDVHHLTINWKLHRADLYTTKTIRNPTLHPPPKLKELHHKELHRNDLSTANTTKIHPNPPHTRTHTFHPSLGAT